MLYRRSGVVYTVMRADNRIYIHKYFEVLSVSWHDDGCTEPAGFCVMLQVWGGGGQAGGVAAGGWVPVQPAGHACENRGKHPSCSPRGRLPGMTALHSHMLLTLYSLGLGSNGSFGGVHAVPQGAWLFLADLPILLAPRLSTCKAAIRSTAEHQRMRGAANHPGPVARGGVITASAGAYGRG